MSVANMKSPSKYIILSLCKSKTSGFVYVQIETKDLSVLCPNLGNAYFCKHDSK